MNILQEQTFDRESTTLCKFLYFAQSIQQLQKDTSLIVKLTARCKQVLKNYDRRIITLEQQQIQQPNDELLNKLLKLIKISIKNYSKFKFKQYEQSLQIISKQQLSNQKQFYFNLIIFFQNQIRYLKQSVISNQIIIQQLQLSKDKYIKQNYQHNNQSVLNTINSYNIYYKICDKYKKKINNLKIKRKNIQKKIKLFQEGNKQNQFGELSLYDHSLSDKKLVLISEIREDNQKKDKMIMTGFQQVLLIYKKKKFTNDKLKENNRILKNKINEKKLWISQLKKSIEEKMNKIVVDQMKNYSKNFYYDPLSHSFSLVNVPFCQSFQMDQDISKILKPLTQNGPIIINH